jgi:parvulin-like peptidyl-prolyl isomerase
MPRKAKKTKHVRVRHEMIDKKTENLISSKPLVSAELLRDPAKAKSFRWGVLAVSILVAAGIYFAASRGWIVAALVNGKPIFGWKVNQALVSRYGAQTLESLISEQLIADAAAKSGVVIPQSDVDAKVNELVESLGPDVKLEDVLMYQGMTRSEFDNQIRLQMTVEKILGKDIEISDEDVDDFIATNRDALTATDEAGLREEAKEAILSQKINEEIQTWFADLKAQAKIVRLFK